MPVSRMRTAPRCAWLVALCLVKSAGGLFLLGSAVSAPSKYTQRFDAMVDDFRKHRPQEIDLVDDPRFRELLHSCRSALDDTKVVLAFQVLYEDLAPVRIGGDLIFRKLDRAVQDVRGSESKAPSTRAIVQDAAAAALVEEKRLAYDASTKEYLAALAWPQPIVDEFVARVAAEVERETLALAAARRVFEAVDADGSGALGKSELVEFGDVIRSRGPASEARSGDDG